MVIRFVITYHYGRWYYTS